ncbi:MAG: ATP synthase F1 subunit delta [Bacteroidia bacterium]|nr:ATP synthase F1 subunit delta [Bacteroidia bacterium]
MIELRLGNRYAKSILELAKEKGELKDVYQDFLLIEQVCAQNSDFVAMLKSPLIFSDKKQNIINLVFGPHFKSKITRMFVEIIVSKKREPYLRDIAQVFLDLHDKEKNITRGVLTSASPLTPAQKAQVLAQVEKDLGTTFELEEKVDPELIGGFVLRVGDLLYDGSISSSIRKLKQEFEKNPYIDKV